MTFARGASQVTSATSARIAKSPTVVEVNNASFTTSAFADQCNDELMRKLGLRNRNMAARLALARSLALASEPPPLEGAERGRTIKGMNLFGDDLRVWLALILEHRESDDVGLEAVQDLTGRHWARGMALLQEDWTAANEDFDKFILSLASQCGLPATGRGQVGRSTGNDGVTLRPGAVTLPLGETGTDLATRERVTWLLNGPGVAPHIAILGAIGSGKTRTALFMIDQIHSQSNAPVILFDMAKGDIATNHGLVSALGATVISPLQTPIPLDVLFAPEGEVKQAAMRFRESFRRVPANRIGDAQGDILREAAEAAFAGGGPVRLRDVYERLQESYAKKRIRKGDIVTANFKDMMAWDLFAPQMTPAEFFSRSWIIDLHKAPETVKRLVCFLLFDAAYTYLGHCEDTPVDSDGNRALRLVMGIDEARLVLGYEHHSLIALVRESRSKGGVLVFMSQSPDDFDQKAENFFENIGLPICFRTAARSTALNKLLGEPVDLNGLKNGECVTRLVGQGLTHVQAWEPA